jgi:hypothetical protein
LRDALSHSRLAVSLELVLLVDALCELGDLRVQLLSLADLVLDVIDVLQFVRR